MWTIFSDTVAKPLSSRGSQPSARGWEAQRKSESVVPTAYFSSTTGVRHGVKALNPERPRDTGIVVAPFSGEAAKAAGLTAQGQGLHRSEECLTSEPSPDCASSPQLLLPWKL